MLYVHSLMHLCHPCVSTIDIVHSPCELKNMSVNPYASHRVTIGASSSFCTAFIRGAGGWGRKYSTYIHTHEPQQELDFIPKPRRMYPMTPSTYMGWIYIHTKEEGMEECRNAGCALFSRNSNKPLPPGLTSIPLTSQYVADSRARTVLRSFVALHVDISLYVRIHMPSASHLQCTHPPGYRQGSCGLWGQAGRATNSVWTDSVAGWEGTFSLDNPEAELWRSFPRHPSKHAGCGLWMLARMALFDGFLVLKSPNSWVIEEEKLS